MADDLSWLFQARIPEFIHGGRMGLRDRMQGLGSDINQTSQQHLGMGLREAMMPPEHLQQMPLALGTAALSKKKKQPLWTTRDTLNYAGLGALLSLLSGGLSSCAPGGLAKTVTNLAGNGGK